MRREALIKVALSSWKRHENDDKATLISHGIDIAPVRVAVPALSRAWSAPGNR
jgi:hypothetical protein